MYRLHKISRYDERGTMLWIFTNTKRWLGWYNAIWKEEIYTTTRFHYIYFPLYNCLARCIFSTIIEFWSANVCIVYWLLFLFSYLLSLFLRFLPNQIPPPNELELKGWKIRAPKPIPIPIPISNPHTPEMMAGTLQFVLKWYLGDLARNKISRNAYFMLIVFI